MQVFYQFMLLLPCFVCLFWGVTFLCGYKTNQRSQNRWIASVSMMGISDFVWNIYFINKPDYIICYKLNAIENLSTLLFYPLFYYYLKSLIGEYSLRRLDIVWFLPSLLFSGWNLMFHSLIGNTVVFGYKLQDLVHVYVYNIAILGLIATIIFFVVRRVFPYLHRNQIYTEGSGNVKYWIIQVQLLMSVLFFLVGAYGRLHFVTQQSYPIFISVGLITWGTVIYYVGYAISKGEPIEATVITINKDEMFLESDETVISNAEISQKTSHLLAILQQMIDEEKIYLQNDLRLEDLAVLMNTNRTYLSRLINEEFSCTFTDFINGRRIEYAQDLMYRFPMLTQEEIARQSGFIYSSSFSRTFRQQTGVTFREWRKKNLIEY